MEVEVEVAEVEVEVEEVEMEVAVVSGRLGSGAVGMAVRSPLSFQVEGVCCDKVISGRAPAEPEAKRVS